MADAGVDAAHRVRLGDAGRRCSRSARSWSTRCSSGCTRAGRSGSTSTSGTSSRAARSTHRRRSVPSAQRALDDDPDPRLPRALLDVRAARVLPVPLVVIVVLYLAAAALLYVVIRRSGVNRWIATAAASAFALFGAGWENAIKPFEMTFTGASRVRPRAPAAAPITTARSIAATGSGWSPGFIGLMFSGIAVTMVAVVGLAVWLRRGWRIGAACTSCRSPRCYSVWWVTFGHTGKVRQLGVHHPSTVGSAIGFVVMGFRGTFAAIGHFAGLGAVLAVLLVGRVGGLAVRSLRMRVGAVAGSRRRSRCSPARCCSSRSRRSGDRRSAPTTRASRATCRSRPRCSCPRSRSRSTRSRRVGGVFLPIAVVVLVVGIPSNLRGVVGRAGPAEPAVLARPSSRSSACRAIRSRRQVPRTLRPEQLQRARRDDRLAPRRGRPAPHPAPAVHDSRPAQVVELPPVALPARRPGAHDRVHDAAQARATRAAQGRGARRVRQPGIGHPGGAAVSGRLRPGVRARRRPHGRGVAPTRRVQISPYDRRRPPRVCTGPGMPKPTPAVDNATTSTTEP